MSFEADRTEILGNLMPGYPNVLDLLSTLDLSKLLGSGGHHPVVLRVLEQNSRSQPTHVTSFVRNVHCAQSIAGVVPIQMVQSACSHFCAWAHVWETCLVFSGDETVPIRTSVL